MGLKLAVNRGLNRLGYTITKTGKGFLDAKVTVEAARRQGLSVCEYRESQDREGWMKGRRDRIVARMQAEGVLDGISRVCEIGAGTGMYLERVLAIARPERYEVYEPNLGWVHYLKQEYAGRDGCTLTCHAADGATLWQSADDSCDLVHAHGVFVYLSLLQTMTYLSDAARVCRPGGHLVFDWFPAEEFSWSDVKAWLGYAYHYPVVISARLLDEFAAAHNLTRTSSFEMPLGPRRVRYTIWQKGRAASRSGDRALAEGTKGADGHEN